MGRREAGPPRQRKERCGPALGRLWTRPSGKRKRSWGRDRALSTLPSLPPVVEVTGHAHVLLAAFEKVSAVLPLDLGVVGRGVVFETRTWGSCLAKWA